MREMPLMFLRGFVMGAADIVPGVSGGTVALVLGIYRRLVASIRHGSSAIARLVTLDLDATREQLGKVEWTFVVPLLAGIGTAVFALSHLIESLLENRPVEMSSLFLGLVAGSVVVAWKLLERRGTREATLTVVAALAFFLLLGLSPGTSDDVVAQATNPSTWFFFVSGSLAICAMILPGISGSFILVSLGMYAPVLATVTDRDLFPLALFLAGCIVGLALFSQLLHWLLEHHYDTIMAVLIGLLVGSVRVLWPWPHGVESTALGMPDGEPVLVPLLLAVCGLVVVLAFEIISERVEHRSVEDEIEDLHA